MLILNVLQKGICSWMVLFDNKLYSDWWKRQQWRNINSPVVVFFTGHYAKIEPTVAPSPILIFLFFVSLLYLLHLPSIFALASYYLGYFHYCCSSLRQLLDHVYLGYCLFKHVHSKTIFFSHFNVVVEFAFFSASSLSLPYIPWHYLY